MSSFGKFPSFAAFINSYSKQRQREINAQIQLLPMPLRPEHLRKQRDVVEVKGVLHVREPDDLDGDKHYRLRTVIREITQPDADVALDLERCIKEQEPVFVAIRYGDRMGIDGELHNLEVGVALHLRGEWIPRDRAYDHGGERTSVLHFTHHPIGFICVADECHR